MKTLILVCSVLVGLTLLVTYTNARSSKDRNQKPHRVVCYLGSWANYRHGNGKFLIEDINPHLCTHLVYGFTKLDNDEITVFDNHLDIKENWGLNAYERFNNLRKLNPQLTTLVAVGGWNEGSLKYSDMALNPVTRKKFVNSVVKFLIRYDFDGLDFDWEYPSNREGGRPEDRVNFIHCLKELREAFDEYGFLLTAAVSAGKSTADTAYDIPSINKYLDFINLMAYDYHGGWDRITGHNSPLYGFPGEEEGHQTLNVNYSVSYWLSHGATADKLVLGMPLYGRCLTLAVATQNQLGAPNIAAGLPGPYTNEPGMIGYNEISERFQKDRWNVVWSDAIKAPYAVKGNQWCGFDNERSIRLKTEYLMSRGLSGAMVWSLETDDFRGLNHKDKYPLIRVINEVLSGRPVTDPTPDPFATTLPTPNTPPPVHNDCTTEGHFAIPNVCASYYQCVKHGNKWQKIQRNCPPGTSFDPKLKRCDFTEQIPECASSYLLSNTQGKTNSLPNHSVVVQSTRRPITSSNPTSSPTLANRSTRPSASWTSALTTSQSKNSILEKPVELHCKHGEMNGFPGDCRRYYQCVKDGLETKVVLFSCPLGTVFDDVNKNCQWTKDSKC